MRGLKLRAVLPNMRLQEVASFTDAWIETDVIRGELVVEIRVASFTDAWIETDSDKKTAENFGSHPLRMRGLKLTKSSKRGLLMVASFTDAWIETIKPLFRVKYPAVASFTDAWIETIRSHPLRMRGLKLYIPACWGCLLRSHPLRMRGLKRTLVNLSSLQDMSHPLRMRGLKRNPKTVGPCPTRRILYGCVD